MTSKIFVKWVIITCALFAAHWEDGGLQADEASPDKRRLYEIYIEAQDLTNLTRTLTGYVAGPGCCAIPATAVKSALSKTSPTSRYSSTIPGKAGYRPPTTIGLLDVHKRKLRG